MSSPGYDIAEIDDVHMMPAALAKRGASRASRTSAVQETEQLYKLLADNTTDIVVWLDLEVRRRYVSPAVKTVLGYEVDELLGTHPVDTVHPSEKKAFRHILDDLAQGRSDYALTIQRYRHKDGHWVWVESSFKLTRDAQGQATGYVASLRDVSQRRAAEDALRLSEERLSLALDSGSDGLWDLDLATGEIELSSHWFDMLGYQAAEIVAHIDTWHELVHPEDAERSRRLFLDHLSGLTPAYECEYRLRQKSGAYAWTLARGKVVSRDHDGRALRVVGTHIDITRRKEAELKIAHMATHDALTGLPNRALFRERLDQELTKVRRVGGGFAILACDLDRFKTVNDSLGHPAGDELLRVIARRLTSTLRKVDTVARLGGDEFAIILSQSDDPRAARAAAKRIIEIVGEPIDLSGHSASIGVSLGIVQGTAASKDGEQLFRHADIALYRAKKAGRNTFCVYDEGMGSEVSERTLLELDLRDAVLRSGFLLHYQPIVDAASRTVSAFEALMRWTHPLRGAIPPAEFIPLAEETGLIVALGTWALQEACREAASWPNDLRVAVNVSAVQFAQPGLEQVVRDALSASGLSADRLELEITESVLMSDAKSVVASLHRLRDLGVRIALDDFGTGYSSLSYLRRFPFDKIKIDRSFIRDIGDEDTAAIVRAIVGLGDRTGATVTAEGVETEEQFESVCREGCTQVQGYLFSKPRPASHVVDFVAQMGRRAISSGQSVVR
ncbi:EAL domain-containing protein [Methylobacterium sp. C25]|uniref:putative bifunctional diguanylate cyclase/phosphodiesterase n=1 Tax=Methylobacterium sp. C25 TaxID=2721622 RepID=UPI002D7F7E73|nr:EAL domain-containing protein [Methylobacterium sp. C25]MCE4222258.1 EAL domain-containing protein [Methylobacterium sp. C25]